MKINFNKDFKEFLTYSKVMDKILAVKYDESLRHIIPKEDVNSVKLAIMEIMAIHNDIKFLYESFFDEKTVYEMVNKKINSPEAFQIAKKYKANIANINVLDPIKSEIQIFFLQNSSCLTEYEEEIKNWPKTLKMLNLAEDLSKKLPTKINSKFGKI